MKRCFCLLRVLTGCPDSSLSFQVDRWARGKGIFLSKMNETEMVFKRFQKENERFKRTMFKFKDNPLIFELRGL